MPAEIATVVAYVGAFVGLVGGGVALFNSRQAVLWKRAELANSYLKDFNNNPELVFAGRCLDWNGGRLVLPETLCPYNHDVKVIEHNREMFIKSLRPDLSISGLNEDPRIQIYRTSIDSFLTWLCLVASAIERKLFTVRDIEEVGYWVAKLQGDRAVHPFIVAYGYESGIDKLVSQFRKKKRHHGLWWFPIYRAR